MIPRKRVEVYNAGITGVQLKDIIEITTNKLLKYKPDIVIYYGAYNETQHVAFDGIDNMIGHWHIYDVWGKVFSLLHYRFMLYTFLVEKYAFYKVTETYCVVPPIGNYKKLLIKFINVLRNNKIQPVLVLQNTIKKHSKELEYIDLNDKEMIRNFVSKKVSEEYVDEYERLTNVRLWQTQILVKVVEVVGKANNVKIINPLPEFDESNDKSGLFCDEVHLSDKGNNLLAEIISREILTGKESYPF